MATLTSNAQRVTKTTHITAIAVGLVALPVALLLAAAYGASAVHGAAHVMRVVLSTAVGGAHIDDLTLGLACALIFGVIVAAVAYAIYEWRSAPEQELHDVR